MGGAARLGFACPLQITPKGAGLTYADASADDGNSGGKQGALRLIEYLEPNSRDSRGRARRNMIDVKFSLRQSYLHFIVPACVQDGTGASKRKNQCQKKKKKKPDLSLLYPIHNCLVSHYGGLRRAAFVLL